MTFSLGGRTVASVTTDERIAASGLRASQGDQLIVSGHTLDEPDRDGEILEVLGEGGAPPYLVRWEQDGHVSQLYPGSDAYVRHLEHAVRLSRGARRPHQSKEDE